jgi:hypothetical protein
VLAVNQSLSSGGIDYVVGIIYLLTDWVYLYIKGNAVVLQVSMR